MVAASVLGGLLPEWVRLTHTRMQLMISFVGGIMLGIAIFHMIPHALVATGQSVDGGDIERVVWGVMLGLLATFFLLRFFHFHQHGPGDFGLPASDTETGEPIAHEASEHADHECSGHHHHNHSAGSSTPGNTRWFAVLVGLGLHTLTDGIALASGVASEMAHGHAVWLPGFGIFLAVLLHKPLDAVSITSLMHPVTTPARRLAVNIGFALMCPLGAFAFMAGATGSAYATTIASAGLAFSAGVFLCIALSDLLPEMEFHSHSRVPLTVALLAGIAAAWAIGLMEGSHAHAPHSEVVEELDHSDHDHGPTDDHAGHNH